MIKSNNDNNNRRQSPSDAAATKKRASRRAIDKRDEIVRSIERERTNLGELTFAELCDQRTIRRMEQLEELIGEYTRITTVLERQTTRVK